MRHRRCCRPPPAPWSRRGPSTTRSPAARVGGRRLVRRSSPAAQVAETLLLPLRLYSSAKSSPPQHQRSAPRSAADWRLNHAAESVARSSTAPHSAPIPSCAAPTTRRRRRHKRRGEEEEAAGDHHVERRDGFGGALIDEVEASESDATTSAMRQGQLPQKSPTAAPSRAACARAARATAQAPPARRARRIAALSAAGTPRRTRSRSGTSRRPPRPRASRTSLQIRAG